MDRKQKKWLIISLLASAVVIFLVLFFTLDFNTLGEDIQKCNIWYILLALLMHIVAIFMWAARIKVMVWSLGYKVPFWHSLNLVCSSHFIASITPAQIGGEPVRIYELTKDKVPVADATAIVVMERVFDAFVLCFGAIFGAVMLNISFSSLNIPDIYYKLSVFAVVFFSLCIFLFIFAAKKPSFGYKLVLGPVGFFMRKRPAEKRNAVLSSVSEQLGRFYSDINHFLGKSKPGFVFGIFFSILFWILEFTIVSVILIGLGQPPNFLLSFIFMILISIIMMIPLTPGGVGIAEVSVAGFYSAIVQKEMLGLLVLLWRLISYYFNLLVGFIATMIILRWEARNMKDGSKKT